jgi:hypothetical protein
MNAQTIMPVKAGHEVLPFPVELVFGQVKSMRVRAV